MKTATEAQLTMQQ